MDFSLRDLVYQHNFSEDTKFELLKIVASPDWVERLFYLLEKDDASTTTRGCCETCEINVECEVQQDLRKKTDFQNLIIALIQKLEQNLLGVDAVNSEKSLAGIGPRALATHMEELIDLALKCHIPKKEKSKTCKINGVVCPCDGEK